MKKKVLGKTKPNYNTLSKKEKLQVALTLLAITSIVIGSLYWMGKVSDRNNEVRISTVNGEYKSAKGLITKIFYYKGRSVVINYAINGDSYEHRGGWDKNPKHLNEGDSISFRYAVSDPSMIITELENEY
jgi:hypothetical protein